MDITYPPRGGYKVEITAISRFYARTIPVVGSSYARILPNLRQLHCG